MELAYPVAGVLHEVAPDRGAVGTVEVHGLAPGGLVAVGEVGPKLSQVVPLRAEVVVDDVQHHAEAPVVAGVDQPAKTPGTAVGRLRRKQVHPVVTPVA